MNMRVYEFLFIAAAISPLGACGGGSSSSNPSTTALSGKAQFGPLNGALVKLHCVSADGTLSDELGSATTNSSGTYTMSITAKPSCSAMLVLSGGTYTEEATGNTVTLATGRTVRSLLGVLDTNAETGVISPLTEMAAARFEQLKESYSSLTDVELEQLVARANEEVRIAAGLPEGVSIATLLPADPTAPNTNADSPENKYALFLAGLSKLAADSNMDSLTIMDMFASDFADGSVSAASWLEVDDKIVSWLESDNNSGGFVIPTNPMVTIATPIIPRESFPLPEVVTPTLPDETTPGTGTGTTTPETSIPDSSTDGSSSSSFDPNATSVLIYQVNAAGPHLPDTCIPFKILLQQNFTPAQHTSDVSVNLSVTHDQPTSASGLALPYGIHFFSSQSSCNSSSNPITSLVITAGANGESATFYFKAVTNGSATAGTLAAAAPAISGATNTPQSVFFTVP